MEHTIVDHSYPLSEIDEEILQNEEELLRYEDTSTVTLLLNLRYMFSEYVNEVVNLDIDTMMFVRIRWPFLEKLLSRAASTTDVYSAIFISDVVALCRSFEKEGWCLRKLRSSVETSSKTLQQVVCEFLQDVYNLYSKSTLLSYEECEKEIDDFIKNHWEDETLTSDERQRLKEVLRILCMIPKEVDN